LESTILNINPSVFGGFANYGYGIVQIENNAAYIQVGSTQYFDQNVDLNLKSQLFVFGPEVTADWSLTDHINIWQNAAYDIASDNSRPTLEFMGEMSTSELKIEDENPTVTYNGEPIESLPYEASGIRLSVGVSYLWHRY